MKEFIFRKHLLRGVHICIDSTSREQAEVILATLVQDVNQWIHHKTKTYDATSGIDLLT